MAAKIKTGRKIKAVITEVNVNGNTFENEIFNPTMINYFYGKNVCFTGTCSYGTRKELLQKIKDVGGIPSDSVTKKTEVLVVGQQDYRVVGEDGMSKKQEKAKALLDKGQDIEILSEIEFLSRI